MLGLKLNHVSKRGPWSFSSWPLAAPQYKKILNTTTIYNLQRHIQTSTVVNCNAWSSFWALDIKENHHTSTNQLLQIKWGKAFSWIQNWYSFTTTTPPLHKSGLCILELKFKKPSLFLRSRQRASDISRYIIRSLNHSRTAMYHIYNKEISKSLSTKHACMKHTALLAFYSDHLGG